MTATGRELFEELGRQGSLIIELKTPWETLPWVERDAWDGLALHVNGGTGDVIPITRGAA